MFPEKHRKSRNRREETPTEGIFRPRKCIFGRLTLNFCLIQVNGSLLRVVFPGIGPLEPIVRITYLRGLRAPRGKAALRPSAGTAARKADAAADAAAKTH